MDINITGRNLALNDHLKEYVHKRVDKLEKLYHRVYKCEVILDEEKERKIAEVIFYLKHNRVVAKESSPDIYASIDNAAENAKKQLRRLHGRVTSRRRKNIFRKIIASVPGFRQPEEAYLSEVHGEIIKTNVFADKPMLPEEAKLELELMDKRVFLVFKNADSGEVNVLYKRGDGNYGLIEPKF